MPGTIEALNSRGVNATRPKFVRNDTDDRTQTLCNPFRVRRSCKWGRKTAAIDIDNGEKSNQAFSKRTWEGWWRILGSNFDLHSNENHLFQIASSCGSSWYPSRRVGCRKLAHDLRSYWARKHGGPGSAWRRPLLEITANICGNWKIQKWYLVWLVKLWELLTVVLSRSPPNSKDTHLKASRTIQFCRFESGLSWLIPNYSINLGSGLTSYAGLMIVGSDGPDILGFNIKYFLFSLT